MNFKGIDYIPNGHMDLDIDSMIEKTYQEVSKYIEKAEFKKATSSIMKLVECGNKYYDERKPWEQKKNDLKSFNDTIYTCANLIANLSNLYEPFMPSSSEVIRKYLEIKEATWHKIIIKPNIKIENVQMIFKKF